MTYQHLYGPIPSRRLGISLGIDPIPHKTCPLNCIYCECGVTTHFTIERKEYISTKRLIEEINHFMQHNRYPDYITFSGSGEPTLYVDLGKVIAYIHTNFDGVRVAVMTNATMLFHEDVCKDLMYADLVLPSLDAISPDVYKKIDYPMDILTIEDNPILLQKFAQEFLSHSHKELWIEIFIVEGINTHEAELERFVSVLQNISYTKIQLNRLDRIGTKVDLMPSSMQIMRYVKQYFEDNGIVSVEIISHCKNREEVMLYNASVEDVILTHLKRRSMSLDDLRLLSSKDHTNLEEYLDYLIADKIIAQHILDGKIIYRYVPSV